MLRTAARPVSILSAMLLLTGWSWSQDAPVPRAAPARVDLNNATQKELEALPGVGRVTAQRIIAARPILDLRQLRMIPGMSEARIYELMPLVTLGPPRPVGPPPDPTAAQPKARSTRLRPIGEPSAPARPAPAASEGSARATVPGAKPAPPANPDVAAKPAPAPEPLAGPTASPARINLNRATLDQLDRLPGIGPVKAQAIIAGRPYRSVEEILKVKGIGPATYAKIKDQITAP